MVHQYDYIWSKGKKQSKKYFDYKIEYSLGANILTLRWKF